MTLSSRLVARLARLPAPDTTAVTVDRDRAIEMPDGAVLLADHWYPATVRVGRAPTVLLRSPYGRRQLGIAGRLFAERGYQALIQSCRGTFGSGGQWNPMRNEAADGAATLAWVAQQPWFDGQLFTFGPSYLGLTQWAVAADPPDFVRAMALTVTSSNFRDAVVYPGGSFALETGLAWLHQLAHQESGNLRVLRAQRAAPKAINAAAKVVPLSDGDTAVSGHRAPFYQDWLLHDEPQDPWWDPIDFGRHLERVPPATLVGGWYDLFLPAQVADYEALVAAGRDVRLTIGPWTHASPRGMGEALRDALAFFDQHIESARPADPGPPVRLFVMGEDRWREFAAWPPPATNEQWFLGPVGTLGPGVDLEAGGPPERYHYDPADPTPASGGPSLNAKSAGRKDQVEREARSDVVTYTSAPLPHPLTVIGAPSLKVYLSSSQAHTDVFVRICDVSPKGNSENISDGIVRIGPSDVTTADDGTFSLSIPLWPTATTFGAGHRIRLQVSSGAYPLFARNPGTGEPLATATELLGTDVEVFHDAAHPSALMLPVVF